MAEKKRERISKEEYRRLLSKYRDLEEWISEQLKSGFKSIERFEQFCGILLKRVDRIVKRLEEEKKQVVQENNILKNKNEKLIKENGSLKEKFIQQNKDWKEKNEKLIKENENLKEKIVQENKDYKAKNEALQKENNILKEENKAFIYENKNFQAIEEKYRKNLILHFLNLQKTLWEIEERYRPYEDFFNDCVLSLQILIGLCKEMDTQTEEKMDYYLWDVIIDPLIRTMKKRNGKIRNGKLVLPLQEEPFEYEKIQRKVQQESLVNLEKYIKEDERRIELKEIVLQKKSVVEDLGRILDELKELVKMHKIEKNEISRFAKEVQFIFERNGIYPMSAEELRAYPNSDLQRRIIPANANSIKYPGLFIRRNGELEVFGTNIGMDD